MTGCERCGAQALSTDHACPVCGGGLRGGVPRPHIPVRRHGRMPPPPAELLAPQATPGQVSLMALALAAVGAALIASGLGFWFW